MKRPQKSPIPDFSEEQRLYNDGCFHVVGLDEVGRGCLAGPVVAAAVILDPDKLPLGVQDSKLLPATKRKEYEVLVKEKAIDCAIGFATPEEIDLINILEASKLAMIRALRRLRVLPHFLLLDGNFRIPAPFPQRSIVKGDQKVLSIASASVIAKVFRDEWMEKLDTDFPGYHFAQNKGYGSTPHRKALEEKGFSAIHRKTFQWKEVRDSGL